MGMSAVERAFQLAMSCATIDEIRRTLRDEGFAQVDAHLGGRMIRRELAIVLRKARQNEEAGGLTPAPFA